MKEQDYQKKISDDLTEQGWYVLNLIKTNKNGITDLIASHPDRITMWVECKTPKGKLSKIQEFRLNELTERGFLCFVSYGMTLKKWKIKEKKSCDYGF